MKTIGLLGGMSWESTVPYYTIINTVIKKRLGDLHSAKIVLYSVDFQEIETFQHEGDWAAAGDYLGKCAQALQKAGADFVVVCTNTMHKVASRIQETGGLPVLHIADATAHAIKNSKLGKVGLLGTRFTMEQEFYKGYIESHHGLKILVPDAEDRNLVHKIIYEELCLGIISDSSRKEYLRIIETLTRQGAEGIILGCTEIGLLIKAADVAVPVFDTAAIHAEAAALHALL
ncbi:aspartate/glutamate racemase family protein [Paralcaligenes sp. KSB-10]|uniref:aspartate/glutamate racemase family protein n=1 Tax=Paralcaligenes sp. KSB-10 TaxID=2901142 RepID=UPI001E30D7E5|nr:aspartate/glutamate racemase family protein [Paralcaligenes sp. KSB-10]UHL65402.1 aspartate/glutamate racemase family protein [Paralcaligenes sp. KSB-10]